MHSNSCRKVRESCRTWMEQDAASQLVTIDKAAVQALAQDIWDKHTSNTATIEWDEEQWHYVPSKELPEAVRQHRLALYILALDAINFCFWPTHHNPTEKNDDGATTNLEYEHLASTMARMALADEPEQLQMASKEPNNNSLLSPSYVFSPARMAGMTVEQMTSLFKQHSTISTTPLDNMTKRCELWNEVGKVLLDEAKHHDGTDLPALLFTDESKKKTAPELVDWIVEHFSGFHDHCYGNNDGGCNHSTDTPILYLYKRAQICVADWNAALQLNLKDMDQVTTFADYRVPQLLRHVGVYQYAPSLAEAIDTLQEIPKDSMEERTIRAATVVAVDELVQELQSQQQQQSTLQSSKRGKQHKFTAVTVDWHLWQVGERLHLQGALKPHHRTRTTFY